MSKAEIIDLMMTKHNTNPCINLKDPIIKSMLLRNRGKLRWERQYASNKKYVVCLSWNKEKLFFNCSIVFLEKQEKDKWKSEIRIDDAHGFRHADCKDEIKMPLSTLLRIECPVLAVIINSLPEEKANVWKIRLFDEIGVGLEKREQFLKNTGKFRRKSKI
jgi:hypothetical protein